MSSKRQSAALQQQRKRRVDEDDDEERDLESQIDEESEELFGSNQESDTSKNDNDSDEEADEESEQDEDEEEDEDDGEEVGSDDDEEEGDGKKPANKNKYLSSDDEAPMFSLRNENDANDLAFEEDSSSEDENINRIGNIPIEWYDDLPHIGYTIEGKKMLRSKQGKQDAIDNFLKRKDWREVYDPVNDRNIKLSEEEQRMIERVRHGRFTNPSLNVWEDSMYETEKNIFALGNPQEPKARFIPSKWEAKMVARLVFAIRNGWIKTSEQLEEERKIKAEKSDYFLMWDEDGKVIGDESTYRTANMPPPKPRLPAHNHSYNPPPEYLPQNDDSKVNYRFKSLLDVPAYGDLMKERFDRCLDLYLCPRTHKKKLNPDPKALLPKLPHPKDLRPFPTTLAVQYIGHKKRITSMSVSPCGQWLATGSEDFSVRIWEVETGRCFSVFQFEDMVHCVSWSPSNNIPLLLVATGYNVLILQTFTESQDSMDKAKAMIEEFDPPKLTNINHARWKLLKVEADNVTETLQPVEEDLEEEKKVADDDDEEEQYEEAPRDILMQRDYSKIVKSSAIVLGFSENIKQITWHRKGDYFATVGAKNTAQCVQIHRLSAYQTACPFGNKSKGIVERVLFHPIKPHFLLGSQRHIHIYNLMKQQLVKKLICPSNWISSISIHPNGDHVLAGGWDCKVSWFDLDLSAKPFKTFRYHSRGVRQVTYHNRYPLFASCSEDGNVHVFHGTVYDDLVTNPLIVPVKIIKAHQITRNMGVSDIAFHPNQPWLFTAGADSVAKLFYS